MKTLYVLRHAKSSWDNSGLADFDRPLNARGRSAAPFMGQVMKREGIVPGLILSSPAVRARETAELAKNSAGLTAEVKLKKKVYEASPETLRQILASLEDSLDSAMIVGHNPGMEGLVRLLTGRSETMQTATLAIIDLDIAGWDAIGSPSSGSLRKMIRPKDEMETLGKGK